MAISGLYRKSGLLARAGVVHGFSLRGGGVSHGAYSSLNLGLATGDDPRAVEENLSRLGAAAGLTRGFLSASQIHGDRVVLAEAAGSLREVLAPTGGQPHQAREADALLVVEPGAAAAVRTADCVPVLLLAEDVGSAAAVHSGWRGAEKSIAGRAVEALGSVSGARPERVIAAIGPCIGRCCYEVSSELASLFRSRFGAAAADDPADHARPHLDLRLCVEQALRRAGVLAERIEQVPGCTSCDAADFFSHRRDQGRTGRHLAFIAAPGAR